VSHSSEGQRQRDAILEFQARSRPEIERVLGSGNYDRSCAAMLCAFDSFASSLPDIRGPNNRRTFYPSAPILLSLYLALRREFGMEQDPAVATLRQVMDSYWRNHIARGRVTRFLLGHFASLGFLKGLVRSQYAFEAGDEYGWESSFPASDAFFALDMTRCAMLKWFTEQGAPEIVAVACGGDYVQAEFMTGLQLVRTQTLADGDPRCSFRYVKAASG